MENNYCSLATFIKFIFSVFWELDPNQSIEVYHFQERANLQATQINDSKIRLMIAAHKSKSKSIMILFWVLLLYR